ncbi:MAG: ABC transporter permease, partial [Saprospiraceae bacterium]
MLINNLKIALRNFKKHRGYNFINVFGLALSLAAVLLIGLWIQSEYRVNRFHSNGEQIYKLYRSFPNERGAIEARAATPFPVSTAIAEKYPEINETTALLDQGNCLIIKDNESFFSSGTYAYFSVFDIFDIPLIAGTKEGADNEINGVFISEKLATRYFGTDWKSKSIGEAMTIEGGDIGKEVFKVLGVFENLPKQSDFQFEFVTNIKKFAAEHTRWASWGSSAFQTYALVNPNTDIEKLGQKISSIVAENGGNENLKIHLQAFENTYLYSTFADGLPTGGRIEYVRIFSLAAAFLLLMACINFINLTTARATRRAKEVGIRKVVGANQSALVTQFMTETGLIVSISVVLAVGLVMSVIPFANELLESTLALNFTDPQLWIGLISLVGITTILAGIYPSLVLSSYKIINILKNKLTGRFDGQLFRKGLVVTQFVLSGMLLISALLVQQQINFIKNKNVGLDRNQVIHLNVPEELSEQTLAFKNQLLQHPNIENVSHISQSPIDVGRATDDLSWAGKDPNQEVGIQFINADKDFAEVYKIKMADGKFYQKATKDVDGSEIVVNQRTVEIMKITDPVSQQVQLGDFSFWFV